MPSHITLHLITVLFKMLSSGQLAYLSTLPLNWSVAKLFCLPEGRLLIQSLTDYLVHIELFEFNLSKEITIDTIIDKSTFCLFAFFQGESVFSDHKGKPISETLGLSSSLSYLRAGSYNWQFTTGQHKFLCITFKEDYFIQKSETIPQFRPLVDASLSTDIPYLALPHCAIAQSLLHLIKKRLVKNAAKLKMDVAVKIIADEILDKYQESLIAKHYDTNTIHKLKVAEITTFIHEHYHEKDIYDSKLLARRFNISERSLMRMVKTTFQMSLHDYILKIRMNKALVELLTSHKTIKEVAANVGYTDQFYFSRVFKKYHKVRPSDVHGMCL